MSKNIDGKVIVITGASSGVGEASARLLSSQGATVVLGARRAERIQALAAELNGKGGKALALPTDVTDRSQFKHLVDSAVETYGRVDVILNNAGVMPHSPLERLKVDDWEHMIDVNLKGVLYGIAAVLPHMKAQKSGHIINTSSVAGHKVRPGSAVYAATKTAVLVISEGLRQEVKPYNIRTTVISPGAMKTNSPTASLSRISPTASATSWIQSRRRCGDLCEYRVLRHQPARRCGHQRDLVPTDKAGALKDG